MRISDWSSDVCSSDLCGRASRPPRSVGVSNTAAGCATAVRSSCRRLRRAQLALQITRRRVDSEASGDRGATEQIGRASCRERVCQYVSISVVAVSLKKKEKNEQAKRKIHMTDK